MLIRTIKLLTGNRIDVIFKILYLRLHHLGAKKIANRLYNDHIKLITNGIYKENGSNKKSLSDYINGFENLYNSIKKGGYNKNISRIPISKEGCISNGSHRLATSVYLNINEVQVEKTEDEKHIYDYKFFIQRGISIELIDLVIQEFISLTKNNYIAIIWPAANKQVNYLDEFPNVFYEKKITLNPRGAQNLVAQVYKEHKWVGSFEEGYGGAISKVNETFKIFSFLHLIFFKENSIDQVIRIKESLRFKFGIDKASIHITDNDTETREIGNFVLNENSIHFLRFGIPYKFPAIFNLLKLFKETLISKGIDFNSIILTGDIVLSIYGFKSTDTIEYLFKESIETEYRFIKNGFTDIIFYEETFEELLNNPKFYFYFNDFKFLSLDIIKKFKSNRNSELDQSDIILIESKKMKKNTGLTANILDYLMQFKFKFIGWIIPISKKFLFYSFAKNIYKIFNSFFKG